MSRVGKLPVAVPEKVKVSIANNNVSVEGPLGNLTRKFNNKVSISQEENNVVIKPADNSKAARSMWGTTRAVINNMVDGVSKGFTKDVVIQGVGFRAALKGEILNLSLGYSHNIKVLVPASLKVEIEKQTGIKVTGIDKDEVGQFAATLISQRPPEPYKGKGVRLKDSYIVRKEGKKK